MMPDGYVALDIEGDLPDVEGGPRVFCAATVAWPAGDPKDTYRRQWWGVAVDEDGEQQIAALMTADEVADLCGYLMEMAGQQGYQIVTWNGASYDMRVLGMASGYNATDAWPHLVLRDHCDVMFEMLCRLGYGASLAKTAEAVGQAKAEGIGGKEVAERWMAGDRQAVADYCLQDADVLAAVAVAALRAGSVMRVTTKGKTQGFPLERSGGGFRLLTVAEAAALPLPDTSWMDKSFADRWTREKYVGWLAEPVEAKPDGGGHAVQDALLAGASAAASRFKGVLIVRDDGTAAAVELGPGDPATSYPLGELWVWAEQANVVREIGKVGVVDALAWMMQQISAEVDEL
jgi:hypothetical protein